jgi:hypothetical protein
MIDNFIDSILVLFMFSPFWGFCLWLYFQPIPPDQVCTDGKFHKWEYDYDIEVLGKDDWRYTFYMNMNGHNIIEINRTNTCKKCGKIVKL